MSVSEVSPRSHVDTPAWQSFETKMRARAAQRRAAKRRRRLRLAALALAGSAGVALGWIGVDALPDLAGAMEIRGASFAATIQAEGARAADAAARAAGDAEAQLSRLFSRLIDVRMPEAPPAPRTFAAMTAEAMPVPASVTLGITPVAEPAGQVTRPPADDAQVEAAPVEPPPAPPAAVTDRPVGTSSPATGVTTSQATARRTPETSRVEPSPAPTSHAATEWTSTASSTTPGGPAAIPISPLAPPPAPLDPVEPARHEPPAESVSSYGDASRAAGEPSPRSPEPASMADPAPARAAVRGAIERYRSAYERLDASAARAVWPAVDAAALSRAFESLESQRLSFESCTIDVAGPIADATCFGRASMVPKIGGGTQTVRRTWRFTLAREGDAWTIARATVR